jgi:hypothetical protein
LFPFYDAVVQEAPMRLLCDEMLARLGRWLRAAGYDTEIATGGVSDQALVARCIAEGRLLLTRDRHLTEIAVARGVQVARLPDLGIEPQARMLRRQLGIDWQHAPFSRCLADNALLAPAPPEAAAQAPPRSRAAGGSLRVCPNCARVYWPGGHVRRMLARLAAWNS